MENYIFINRWMYNKPNFVPNKEGNIVIISKRSFGPLEIYEWGLDKNNIPYERYEWLEDDYFADSGYIKNITKEELLNEINSVTKLFCENGVSEWNSIFDSILDKLNEDSL